MEVHVRIELTYDDFADRCLSAWLMHHIYCTLFTRGPVDFFISFSCFDCLSGASIFTPTPVDFEIFTLTSSSLKSSSSSSSSKTGTKAFCKNCLFSLAFSFLCLAIRLSERIFSFSSICARIISDKDVYLLDESVPSLLTDGVGSSNSSSSIIAV